MVQIRVPKNVKYYAKQHGNIITIEEITQQTCCSTITKPVINTEIPSNPTNFKKFEVDGIFIYIQNVLLEGNITEIEFLIPFKGRSKLQIIR